MTCTLEVSPSADVFTMSKILQIRVTEEFLKKLDYLRFVNGYANLSKTVREIIEKEYRKETSEVKNNGK